VQARTWGRVARSSKRKSRRAATAFFLIAVG